MRGRPGFAAPRPGMGIRPPVGLRAPMVRGPVMTRRGGFFFPPGSGPFFPNRFGQPFFFHGKFGQPFFFRNRFRFRHRRFFNGFWGPSGFYGGYGYAYPYYPYSFDYESAAGQYNQQSAQAQYQLQQQVNQLGDDVVRLREQVAELESATPPTPPPAPAAVPSQTVPPPPTTLVFRDGKTQEVQNYAIVGHTLWIFSEQRARKVPLSELNIPATMKANEERDVPFQVPLAR